MPASYMSPLSFPETVLRRPSMYTSGGTFEEVIAFLKGFISGVAQVDMSLPLVRRWADFEIWLIEQLDLPPTSYLFRDFKAQLDVNQDACAELLKWVSRFQAEVPEPENRVEDT